MTTTTNRNEVTFEMLSKAHRNVAADGQVYYTVESRTTDGVEYEVRYNRTCKSVTCTCPAMNPPLDFYGFPLYAPRQCWHVRTALQDAKLYREEQAIKQDYEAGLERIERLVTLGLTHDEAALAVSEAHMWIVNGAHIDDETLARVYCSHQYPTAAEADRQAEDSLKPFSLLK